MNEEIVVEKKKEKLADEPPLYTVVLFNDDYTPMDLVAAIICEVFSTSYDEAMTYTMTIHNNGKAEIGEFTREIAETKSNMVNKLARDEEHPLLSEIKKL